MTRSILVVSDDEDMLRFTDRLLKPEAYTATCASLTADKASDTCPYIGDVLRQCRESGKVYDAVMIYDLSKPKTGSGLEFLHGAWVTAGNKLKTLETDMERERIHIGVSSNDDPTAVSARYEALMRSFDAMHQARLEEHRTNLTHAREAAEALMLTNPPSEKGISLVRALRAGDSPYRNAPIAVTCAHPDREAELLKAGATLVHTSADAMQLTPNDILDVTFDMHLGTLPPSAISQLSDTTRKGQFADRVCRTAAHGLRRIG